MTYKLADEENLDETPLWYAMNELGYALRHNDIPKFQIAPFLFYARCEINLNSKLFYYVAS